MKALTVRQPWAWCIAAGYKDVENRARGLSHRGDIAIHAGAGWSPEGENDRRVAYAMAGLVLSHQLTKGAIVAVASLVDSHVPHPGCCPDTDWADTEYAGKQVGAHLVLRDVRRLWKPVPGKGALGIWRVPEDVEAAVHAVLSTPAVA